MIQFRSILPLALVLVLPLLPTRAAAQIPWDTQLTLGVSAGPDAVPAAMRAYDVDPREQALGFGVAARGALSLVGPASVEGRVGISSGPRDLDVVYPNDAGEVFTLELERSAMRPSMQGFWDLRLRLDAPSGPVATVGGGLMTDNIRFLVGSVGHRWGATRAFGLDLEVAAYDLQWERITYDVHVDWTDYENPVATIVDGRVTDFRRWDLGVGLRFVYERTFF